MGLRRNPRRPARGHHRRRDLQGHNLYLALDAWENLYFDLADATLKFNFPAVHERLFLNLHKTSGIGVLVSVRTFLQRLGELEQEGGEEIEAAIALLAKRGLNQEQRDLAAGMVEAASSLTDAEPEDMHSEEIVARDAALVALWHWYLEWSAIGRTVIKSKRMRILMGLSKPSRSRTNGAEDVAAVADDLNASAIDAAIAIANEDGANADTLAAAILGGVTGDVTGPVSGGNGGPQ